MKKLRLLFVTLMLLCLGGGLTLDAREPGINWPQLEREALELFADYLRIDTTNPPGGEIAAARFFAAICKSEGIEHRVFEPFPGRGTLWARIRGDGSKRPLVLLNHTDVVPHSPEFWTAGAFSATERDGFIYGRGAMDMKSLGLAQFVTMLALKRSGAKLKRDVIFLATADEEAGGREGAGWFAKTHPELLGNAEFLLNEGAGNLVDAQGAVRSIGVGPGEKTPVWLRLTATGTPGHASVPVTDSSVNRLIRALGRLIDYKAPVQVTPVVEQSFRAFAPLAPASLRARYENLRESIKDPDFLRLLESDPRTMALLRNTITVTMLGGSAKVNVIPPAATAEIDTRVVPGEDVERWIAEIRSVIADPGIRVESVLAFAANASPVDSEIVKTIGEVGARRYSGAVLTFPVLAGFTDSHYFRDLGIASYGFSPFVASPGELGGGFHGNDERIGKKAFLEGIRFHYDVVAEIVK